MPEQPHLAQRNQLRAAQRHHAAGDWSAAAAAYQELLQKHPGDAELHFLLGAALRGLGRAADARSSLQKALRTHPNHADSYHELALTYKQEGRFAEAQRVFDKALKLHPNEPTLLAAKAELLYSVGNHDAALALIEPLLAQPSPHIALAMTFALLAGRGDRRAEAAQMLSLALAAADPPPALRADALFRLGDLYDGMGDHDKAFEAFDAANRTKAVRFEPESFSALATLMIQKWTPAAMDALPRAAVKSERPVFIIGMPRSGTTLVEQILASHPMVHGGGELNGIPRLVHEWQGGLSGAISLLTDLEGLTQTAVDRAARDYLHELKSIAPASARRVTDKMPLNFLHLGLIALLWPSAQVIHCMRDPMDTCLSCYVHHFAGSNPFAYSLEHLGRFYRDYERIMSHWHRVIASPILEVRYEELVENPETMSRRMINFIGLEWNETCLRFHENRRVALTASQHQVRRPIYRSSMMRWKAYEKFLDPLKAALASS